MGIEQVTRSKTLKLCDDDDDDDDDDDGVQCGHKMPACLFSADDKNNSVGGEQFVL
jgi:hypothetical protein